MITILTCPTAKVCWAINKLNSGPHSPNTRTPCRAGTIQGKNAWFNEPCSIQGTDQFMVQCMFKTLQGTLDGWPWPSFTLTARLTLSDVASEVWDRMCNVLQGQRQHRTRNEETADVPTSQNVTTNSRFRAKLDTTWSKILRKLLRIPSYEKHSTHATVSYRVGFDFTTLSPQPQSDATEKAIKLWHT